MLEVPSKALGSAVEGKVWGCRVWVKRPGMLVCVLGFRVGGYGHGIELGGSTGIHSAFQQGYCRIMLAFPH